MKFIKLFEMFRKEEKEPSFETNDIKIFKGILRLSIKDKSISPNTNLVKIIRDINSNTKDFDIKITNNYSILGDEENNETIFNPIDIKFILNQKDKSWGGIYDKFLNNEYHIQIICLEDEYYLIRVELFKNKGNSSDKINFMMDGRDNLKEMFDIIKNWGYWQ